MSDPEHVESEDNVFVMKPPPVSYKINYKEKLNGEQYEAVMHETGAALVIAGAGSGKTRVLTYRVARLIESGVPPQAIMLVTFTKKAAEEMIGRVQKLVDFSRNKLVGGTFHSVANRFLRKNATLLGFEPNFAILDESDAEQVMKKALGEVVGGKEVEEKKRYPTPANLVNIYSRSMNLHLQVKDVLANFYQQFLDLEPDIQHILRIYFDTKQKNNLMDFDDLLVYFLRLLRTDGANERIFKQVRHLVVEYQDVNQLQADIVIELGQRAESTMVVGDDAQSIYSFRGASVQHMLDFDGLMPDVKKYYLVENYRSTPQILNLANASIKHNKNQFKKDLTTTAQDGMMPQVVQCIDDDEESNFLCQHVIAARDQGTPYHEQAVLFRSTFQSILLEKALLTYKIPYVKRAGLRFYETAHVKDMLSFALLLQNQRNEIAWSRLLGLLPGMGPASIERVVAKLFESSDPLSAFVSGNLKNELKGKRVQETSHAEMRKLQEFYKQNAVDAETGTILPAEKLPRPDVFFAAALKVYEPLLKNAYKKDAEDRLLELREFIGITGKYTSIDRLLEEIAISETFVGETSRSDPKNKDEKHLVLSTIHQAKGLEWDIVYVMGTAENLLPSSYAMDSTDELEEERRLFYVASTRPRKELYFSYAQVKWTFSKNVIMKRSSFLEEIEKDKVFQVLRLQHDYEVTTFESLLR